MIDFSKLDELKRLIQTAEDLSEPWDFFYDHFGNHAEFLDHGKRVKSPLLNELCKQVARAAYGAQGAVTHKSWVGLKKHRFIHGSAQIGDHLAIAIFFTDIDMGMLSFTSIRGTQVMRFTTEAVKTRGLAFPRNFSHEVH